MILEYHRPKTLEEALRLIAREDPRTYPLGGGSYLSLVKDESFAVVDLQELKLNQLKRSGNNLEIGATATLQSLVESPLITSELHKVLKLESNINLRQVGTVAGALVSSDGRSPLATAFLALDARLKIIPPDEEINFGNFIPLRAEILRKRMITSVTIPLNVKFIFASVSRTPADRPIVITAHARWPSGRTRLALGGFGKFPFLAMDGTEQDGLISAAQNAFQEATDEWASAEYRMDAAATLVRRGLEKLNNSID